MKPKDEKQVDAKEGQSIALVPYQDMANLAALVKAARALLFYTSKFPSVEADVVKDYLSGPLSVLE